MMRFLGVSILKRVGKVNASPRLSSPLARLWAGGNLLDTCPTQPAGFRVAPDFRELVLEG